MAQIAYEAEPTYERYGPDQPTHTQLIAWALEDLDLDTATHTGTTNVTNSSAAQTLREVDGAQ